MLRSGLNTRNTLQLSEIRTPRYSAKRTAFAVPLVPAWTVQNLVDNADAVRPLAQDCPAPLYATVISVLLIDCIYSKSYKAGIKQTSFI